MRRERYVVYADLIDESLPEDLATNLPGLRFHAFSDHNSFCQRLHADLEKTLQIKVHPLFCATADRLQDRRQYASDFDCTTAEPVSGKHQMWLDFRKPLNLGTGPLLQTFLRREPGCPAGLLRGNARA